MAPALGPNEQAESIFVVAASPQKYNFKHKHYSSQVNITDRNYSYQKKINSTSNKGGTHSNQYNFQENAASVRRQQQQKQQPPAASDESSIQKRNRVFLDLSMNLKAGRHGSKESKETQKKRSDVTLPSISPPTFLADGEMDLTKKILLMRSQESNDKDTTTGGAVDQLSQNFISPRFVLIQTMEEEDQ